GHPAAWWRLKIGPVDLLIIVWPSGSQTAYSPEKQVLLMDAGDLIQTIHNGLAWWQANGFKFGLEEFAYQLTRRVFYEELGHVQDAASILGNSSQELNRLERLKAW